MIIRIDNSPRKVKRFRITMDDGRVFDFGYKRGETYIDHGDKTKRRNYWRRHLANDTEERLIDNLVPSPALFSAYLLWGNSTSLEKNVNHLNRLWKNKYTIYNK